MPLADPALLVILAVLVSIAALVNGMVGFGFALLAINALALVLPAKDGVIVMSLLAPLMSGSQLWHHRARLGIVRRTRGLIIGALIGSIIGTQLLVILPAAVVSLALGVFTLWFVVSSLRAERPPLAHATQRWLGPVAGVVGGITNGALGASGPVFGTYLTAIGLRGVEFAVAISFAFFTMGILRAGLLVVLDQFTTVLIVIAATLAVPSIVVQRLGFHLQGRLPRATIYRAVLIVLTIGGLNLVWRGLTALLA
jgi:uncharacterized membrane protein YfcA